MEEQPKWKWVQDLVKWSPTGGMIGFTAYCWLQDQGITSQTILSSTGTAVLAIWTAFSGGFMEEFKKEVNQRGKTYAQALANIIFERFPKTVRWKLSRFEQQYKKSLFDYYRDFKTEGFKIGLPVLDLEDVFVPLKLAVEIPRNVANNSLIPKTKDSSEQEIWTYLANSSQIRAYQHIAILAPPGYGKTTLLQKVTLTYAKKAHRKYKAPDLVPILLYLRNQHKEITGNSPPTLPELINAQVKNQPAFKKLTPPPHWFSQRLKKGKCLVMLDGLDEVANAADREKVSKWVNEQIQQYSQCLFLLTSRPHGYDSNLFEAIGIVLEVKSFNIQQIKQFIHRWYLQTECRMRQGRLDPAVEAVAKDNADNLIDRIIKNPSICQMASNPLLVTMIATVHYCGDALPGRRVELYKKICDVLLGARQSAKKIETPLTGEQNKSVLQVLALELMQRETRKFTLTQGTEIIKEKLSGVNETVIPEDFLKQIKEVNGLLVEKELGYYEFAHLSFQEYLAAAEVKESQGESLLLEKFENPWCAEMIRLYAAQSDATNLIQFALDNPTSVKALKLALDCDEEALRVEAKIRQQLKTRLDESLESLDPELFKVASEAILARNLSDSNFLQIDENLVIAQSYITNAEYQVFLDDEVNKIKFETRFESGDSKKNVSLNDWESRDQFCDWLTRKAHYFIRKRSDSTKSTLETCYRLISKEELKHSSISDDSEFSENGIRLVRLLIPDVKYRQLAAYLAAGKWAEADQETANVMLQVSNRESEGYLRESDINNFPCDDLRTIDQLWVHYSKGKFGFSVQKKIYMDELGGTRQYNKKIWEEFCDRVGWRKVGDTGYSNLTWELQDTTPVGHLPAPRHLPANPPRGPVFFSRAVILLSRKDL
ncbi:GUN4 domain-containing protein [Crocosphaera sp.]|uniref:GUN4 domain-containing protein n=1 Tax=Crocosphaera sp. TaxID=2729996 RepID=UPI0026046194|nr:GUN4 domain-containing protein [Crocosphaera sp.]MDJ0580315.1 GUN4 domain-containing protein [Crocosphaera sp.]